MVNRFQLREIERGGHRGRDLTELGVQRRELD
jgi:hypothetical protein